MVTNIRSLWGCSNNGPGKRQQGEKKCSTMVSATWPTQCGNKSEACFLEHKTMEKKNGFKCYIICARWNFNTRPCIWTWPNEALKGFVKVHVWNGWCACFCILSIYLWDMLVLGHLFLGQKLGMHDIYWYQIDYQPVLEIYSIVCFGP